MSLTSINTFNSVINKNNGTVNYTLSFIQSKSTTILLYQNTQIPIDSVTDSSGNSYNFFSNVYLQYCKYKQFLTLTNSTDYTNTTGTIEVWFLTNSLANVDNSGCIFGRPSSTGTQFGIILYGNNISAVDTLNNKITSAINVNDGNLHHAALTYQSGVTNGSVLYIDGAQQGTGTLYNNNFTNPYYLGYNNIGVSAHGYFFGYIVQARIWNTNLSSTLIGQYYNQIIPSTTSGLTGYWQFKEPYDLGYVSNSINNGPSFNNTSLLKLYDMYNQSSYNNGLATIVYNLTKNKTYNLQINVKSKITYTIPKSIITYNIVFDNPYFQQNVTYNSNNYILYYYIRDSGFIQTTRTITFNNVNISLRILAVGGGAGGTSTTYGSGGSYVDTTVNLSGTGTLTLGLGVPGTYGGGTGGNTVVSSSGFSPNPNLSVNALGGVGSASGGNGYLFIDNKYYGANGSSPNASFSFNYYIAPTIEGFGIGGDIGTRGKYGTVVIGYQY